jgi:hypothetical protein
VGDRKDGGSRIPPIQPALEQRQLQRRRVERVPHLVRQAGRQRPDCRQPLGAQQAAQDLVLVGDVDADRVGGDLVVPALDL